RPETQSFTLDAALEYTVAIGAVRRFGKKVHVGAITECAVVPELGPSACDVRRLKVRYLNHYMRDADPREPEPTLILPQAQIARIGSHFADGLEVDFRQAISDSSLERS